MAIQKSNPKAALPKADDVKVYSKNDVARMLNDYCEHIMTAVMRRDEHVKIADYLDNPRLISQDAMSTKYLETNKLFGANG